MATRRDGEERPGVHVLWARRKIDALMHSQTFGEADVERRRLELVGLALAHHLVSAFTSLVVVDVTPLRRDNEALASHAMGVNLPAGWNPASFGLAAGATAGPWHRSVGLLLLGVGALLGPLLRLVLPQRGIA